MTVVEQSPAVAPAQSRRASRWPRRLRPEGNPREWLTALVLLSPALVILGLFHIFPMFYAAWISTRDWRRLRDRGYIGIDNYIEAFTNGDVWRSFGNTVWFALGTVPFEIILGVVIAYLLFQRVRFLSFFRTAFFLPYVTSTVAAAAVWLWIFDPRVGVMNTILGWFGAGPFRWIQEPKGIFEMFAGFLGVPWPGWADGPSLALVAIMVVTIWHYLGFHVVIYLVGLGNVPKDLYEAARVDGANERQLFFRITLPMLTPTILFGAIIATIGSFQSFNQIYQMTVRANVGGPGGPLGTTETMVIKILNEFQTNFFGYGSALSMMLFAVILLLTIIQLWASRKWVRY